MVSTTLTTLIASIQSQITQATQQVSSTNAMIVNMQAANAALTTQIANLQTQLADLLSLQTSNPSVS